MNVAIACGGTGGHIFPGIAVGEGLRARGHSVTLWLGARNVEDLSTSAWDGPVVRIRAAGFPSGLSLRTIGVLFRLAGSIWTCWRHMRRERPDAVLAMGSYASVGPGVAAHLLRIPLVLHESNAIPGKAVLVLAKYAAAIGLGFERAEPYFSGRRREVVGFPLRDNLQGAPPLDGLENDRFTILVMGGSQGAHALNVTVPDVLCAAVRRGLPLQVIHLSGAADEASVRSRYEEGGVPARTYGFLDEMGRAYAAADLAICRAGAASCAELALCALPSMLVPLPSSARDHQRENARAMVVAGGADLIEQDELSVNSLLLYIERCIAEPDYLEQKRAALARMQPGDAVTMMCELVEEAGEVGTAEQPLLR
ncbi:MAG: UDP-N-acetylglucosamine--N-acetylmuramyl-(pentapeptide) pyrophosphoryl-undecaprenol N-acetylglucosamine transferase [Kiritimatiellia bacterium]|jgi:UDP-N-acetylglucosamine--N-acetylmuramyl-(pentapeptide) pyrophosphoryl-undecaprenol N-acetylglucosamine transferase|nr:UDP-N-acetylglucosamine--N-acetylmuramyl-(pentapeptide) pyrophosphoryl-undecaprenol N-acetylglucosamine transferase [Kiritimatiellia bacterium]MDP7023729.1 UDP-N-acetylglucosamine--N-acetylmuramyl-(pentapeptide) pyrophosphoryl-undecaprenol N-acetylglucosamine transferase [Kiritimatiellia bacterium]